MVDRTLPMKIDQVRLIGIVHLLKQTREILVPLKIPREEGQCQDLQHEDLPSQDLQYQEVLEKHLLPDLQGDFRKPSEENLHLILPEDKDLQFLVD